MQAQSLPRARRNDAQPSHVGPHGQSAVRRARTRDLGGVWIERACILRHARLRAFESAYGVVVHHPAYALETVADLPCPSSAHAMRKTGPRGGKAGRREAKRAESEDRSLLLRAPPNFA